MKSFLLNYVYHPPVGHAIEALRYALGYRVANPDFEISLALHKYTPTILTSLCPWIKNTYSVEVPSEDDSDQSIKPEIYNHIPREWDYVVDDFRSKTRDYCPESFFEYYQQSRSYFKVKMLRGFTRESTIPYEPDQQLIFSLPPENLNFANSKLLDTKIRIGIMLAGNKDPKFFPSLNSWELIIGGLYAKYGDNLSIYFFGKLSTSGNSTVSGITRKSVDYLLNKYPRSVDCFDIGLLNQLAIGQRCNLFISPHTGFAFAMLCVGTPWLTISGGTWVEYFFNNVAFHSVLPNPAKYPAFNENDDYIVDDNGEKRIASMAKSRIKDDLPEIISSADKLINKEWSFDQCMKDYFSLMKKYYPSKIYAFDHIHTKYI